MFTGLRGLTRAQLLLVGVVFLLPLVHSAALYRHFSVPQQAVLLLALGGAIAAGSTGTMGWIKAESRPVKASLVLLWAVVGWLGLATAVGVDPARSLSGEDSQGTGLMMWVVSAALFHLALTLRRQVLVAALGAIRWALVVCVVLGVMWATGGDAQIGFVPVSEGGVPLAGVGNPALLAALLSAGLLAILGAASDLRRWGWWAAVTMGGGVYLMVCQNRVATFTTLAAVVVGGAFSIRNGASRSRILGLAGVLVAGMLIGQFWAAPAVRERSEQRLAAMERRDPRDQESGALRFSRQEVSGGLKVRVVVWTTALRSVGQHPILGIGPANLSLVFPRLADRSDIVGIGLARFQVDDAHDIFIEVAQSGGIPAAILLLGWLLSVLLGMRKTTVIDEGRKRGKPIDPGVDRSRRGLTWIRLIAAMLLAQHLFQPLSLSLTPLLMVAAALSISPPRIEAVRASSRSSWRVVLAGTVASMFVVGALVLMFAERRLSFGSLEWDRGALATAVNLNPTCQICKYELGKVRRWDHTRDGVKDQAWAMSPNLESVRDHPLDDEALVQAAGGYLFLKEPRVALPFLVKARELNPYSTLALRGLAVAHLRLREPGRAIPYLKELVYVSPTFESYDLLATAAREAGDDELANSAAHEASIRSPQTDEAGPSKR